MNTILELQNIEKKYFTTKNEIQAIKNITFKLKENDFIAIVGPSGCGKSTLLSIIGNIDKNHKGTITFPTGKKKIGYMFQQDCLFPWLTILDNCLLGLKIEHNLTEENKNYAISLLNKYGLKDFIYKYPNNLSGGMRQRVG